MTPGTRMVRLEDGMAGIVELVQPPGYPGYEPRITFSLHGERLVAGKQEKWVPADAGPLPLREEEKLEVARVADHWLECIVKHLPRYTAGALSMHRGDPFDAQFVKVIVDYLGTRHG